MDNCRSVKMSRIKFSVAWRRRGGRLTRRASEVKVKEPTTPPVDVDVDEIATGLEPTTPPPADFDDEVATGLKGMRLQNDDEEPTSPSQLKQLMDIIQRRQWQETVKNMYDLYVQGTTGSGRQAKNKARKMFYASAVKAMGKGNKPFSKVDALTRDLFNAKEENSNSNVGAANDLFSNIEEDEEVQHIHQELQGAINKHPFLKDHVKPSETVVKYLEMYLGKYRETSKFNIITTRNDKILQVAYKESEEVLSEIGKMKAFARNHAKTFPVPSRADAKQGYDTKHKRHVLESMKSIEKDENIKGKNEHKYEIIDALLTIIYELCMKEITSEIRDVYYRNPNLFKNRDKVGASLDDICCMIGCTRSSLHVYASEKGSVFGNISFCVGKHQHYCSTLDMKGPSIPSKTDKIHSMENRGALFVLVVEKETVFQRLVEDEFCEKYRCILITGKGMPDVATRFFLRKMSNEFKLPVFALMDFDPYGYKILSVYRNGSNNMSFDSENLVTPDIQLIGMLHTDIEKYQIPEQFTLKMTESDINTAKSLSVKPYFSEEEKAGLQYMVDKKIKCEIEGWGHEHADYMSQVVLPLKFQDFVQQVQLQDTVSDN